MSPFFNQSVSTSSLTLVHYPGGIDVVYFDPLLGAARNQKLDKLLFSAVFNLFC